MMNMEFHIPSLIAFIFRASEKTENALAAIACINARIFACSQTRGVATFGCGARRVSFNQ